MNLTGNKIKNSYKALLTFPGATGMVSNPTDLKQMGDGGGNNTPFYLSTTQAGLQYTGQTADTTFIGFTLRNNTSAAASDMQHSPFIEQVGNGYTASSKQIGFRYGVVPTSGTAGYWAIDSSVDGALATYTNRFKFYDTGSLTTVANGSATNWLVQNQEANCSVIFKLAAGPTNGYPIILTSDGFNGYATITTGASNVPISLGTSTRDLIVDASHNVGIGTLAVAISAKLHVIAEAEQLRLGWNAGNFTSFTTSSSGNLTIAPSGGTFNVTGICNATSFSVGAVPGVSGTITAVSTVTVVNGIITAIV